MKALSPEAVKRLAFQHGASLDLNGSRVNTARLQVAATAPKPKAPEPAYMPVPTVAPVVEKMAAEPDPALAEAVKSIDGYAASQFILNEQQLKFMQMMAALMEQMSRQTPTPDKRPTKWVFNVKRDQHGLMERIEATAKP